MKINSFYILNRPKLISILTCISIGLMSIENTEYFINIGVSIRPYYITILLLCFLIGNSSNKRIFRNDYILFSLLILCGILGVAFNPLDVYNIKTLNYIIVLLFQLLTFVILLNAFSRSNLEYLFRGLRITFFFVVIIPLFLFIFFYSSMLGVVGGSCPGIYTGHDGVPRMIGLYADPNYFSFFILSYLSFLLYLKYNNKINFSIIDYLSIGIAICNVMMSFSRSAIGVILVFIFSVLIIKPSKTIIYGLVMILLIIAGIVINMEDSVIDLILERFSDTGKDGSSHERLFLLSNGIEAPLHFPLGVGVGQCRTYYGYLFNLPKLAHNDYITVLVESGILGLFAYLCLWIQTFIISNKYGRIFIFCLMLMCGTLTCYNYEPVIPLILSFYSFFNKNEIKYLNNY